MILNDKTDRNLISIYKLSSKKKKYLTFSLIILYWNKKIRDLNLVRLIK